MEIIFLVLGIVIGSAAVFFILKFKSQGLTAASDEKTKYLTLQNESLAKDLSGERDKVSRLNSDHSSLKADHNNLLIKLDEQKVEMEQLQNKFTKEFENLANKILEEKSKKFTDQNKSNLDDILKPLNEKIRDFEKTVNEIHNKDTRERATLAEQLKSLHNLNQQMSRDAVNLTKALKGDSKTQGSWGELILETILEKSGLEKGREYEVQSSYTSEEGKRFRPDVIINLPDSKSIIVDSKVSLTAYEAYCSAEDEDAKTAALNAHIASIRNHIKGLSVKNYQSIYQLKSLDIVIMFIPIEPAFSLAIQCDNKLWTEAFDKNIMLVSPTTLLGTLRIIHHTWKQEYQNRHALDIASKSGALYDKFESLIKDLIDVGNRMKQAQGSYEDAMKKLHSGRGNLISQVESIKKLGAKTTKSLPQNLVERASEFDNTIFPDE